MRRVLSQNFKTLVAVLIALVTVSGAFAAWRASIAEGNVGSAKQSGILSAIARERVQTAIRTSLYKELRFFADYLQYGEMADLLGQAARQASQEEREEKSEALAREAEAYRDLADSAHRSMDYPQYIIKNDRGQDSYDVEGFIQGSLAIEASLQDLNPEDDFQRAEHFRQHKQPLVAAVIILAVALLFFTLAEITETLLRYAFVSVGLLGFLAATAVVIIEAAKVP